MYGLSDLRKHLELYAQKHPNAVMLVRADRQVSVQDFFSLCDMARAAGFAGVQAAAEPQASASRLP
jgi:biopolymer transport protein ExbD